MFSLGIRPKKSSLSKELYEEYKIALSEALSRYVTFDMEIPKICYDDKYRQIILTSFDGCIDEMNHIISIPEGITTVYVKECESLLGDLWKEMEAYSIVLSDTVENIDSLPLMPIRYLDTRNVKSIKNVKDNMCCRYMDNIECVVVRDSLDSNSCIGHCSSQEVIYLKTKPYKVNDYTFFNPIYNLFIDNKCKSVKKCLKGDNSVGYYMGETYDLDKYKVSTLRDEKDILSIIRERELKYLGETLDGN